MEHTTVCSATGPYIDGGGSEDADCSLCCRQRPAQLRKHADEKRLRLMVVCYPRSFSSLPFLLDTESDGDCNNNNDDDDDGDDDERSQQQVVIVAVTL